ncbi:helix-turn-helix domain-containing protein [Rhizobium tumorigenes]|uniref:helix-turn-helix domain-containing protein n=1 Tax=Rhizobium tumorigenes TaxID=2041385 RepID=UPI00241C8B92|nr:helix-turn-helix transcriptional regulator [Rhizobium tumorigenes]WFS02375.1 helix-turn-helix transcriptional regulator [Rhizobium tumorigenes]
MNVHELLHKVAESADRPADGPTAPPVELVALVVRTSRGLRQWKVSTLADFARVSVSTIERVERGEKVGEEALDRIAMALGFDRGAFHEPRLPIGKEEVAKHMQETYGNLAVVDVAPMRTHRAVRQATRCQAIIVHSADVPASYDEDIASLTEWLDFASFALSDLTDMEGVEEISRRKLYEDILSCVSELERRGLNIQVGVVDAPQPKLPNWKVAVLSITTKLADPAAGKRSQIFIDRRNFALANTGGWNFE